MDNLVGWVIFVSSQPWNEQSRIFPDTAVGLYSPQAKKAYGIRTGSIPNHSGQVLLERRIDKTSPLAKTDLKPYELAEYIKLMIPMIWGDKNNVYRGVAGEGSVETLKTHRSKRPYILFRYASVALHGGAKGLAERLSKLVDEGIPY